MAAEPDADPLDELTREEKQELVDIVKARRDDHISRRDALKAAGLIGSGALLGGGASSAALDATGKASAGTAESGTIGTDANPVDAHIEDLSGPGGAITLQDNLAGNQKDISNLNSLTTNSVSRNVGHGVDYLIFDDPSTGNGKVVDSGGNIISEETTGARLLPVLDAAIQDADSGDVIQIRGPTQNTGWFVDDGQAIVGTEWPNGITIWWAPGANVGVNQSMTNSVGPDNRSVLIDVRNTTSQTQHITFISTGARINCNDRVDIPFYFADNRQGRIIGFEFDSPSVGPYRFGNEEASTTAQFNYAKHYQVFAQDTTPTHGGKFVGLTDAHAVHARITALTGVIFDGCPHSYPDDIFLATASVNQNDVIEIRTDAGGASGWISRCRYEGGTGRSILRLDATTNDITEIGGGDIWQVNGGSVDSLISAAENGGNISSIGPFELKGSNVRDANATNFCTVTSGDPFSIEVFGTLTASNSDVLNNLDRGPNTSTVICNQYAFEAAGAGNSPTLDVPTGYFVENTDDGTVWARASGDSFVQLG